MSIHHDFVAREASETGWSVVSMTVFVDTLDRETVMAVPQYLIEHVPQLVEKAKGEPYTFFPIEIDIRGSLRFSERLLWEMVIEASYEAADLIVAYVDRLCDCVRQNGMEVLFYSADDYCAGSHAIFAYLDHLGEAQERQEVFATKIYECFIRYLQCVDLDHEVHQDEYITRALRELEVQSDGLYLALLHLRLFNGQYSILSKGYDFFSQFIGTERFRAVLDFVLERNDAEYLLKNQAHDMDHYLRLIASVYGTNRQCTEDIASYIQGKVKADIVIPTDIMATSHELQLVCDAHRAAAKPKRGFLDSGFHRYDTNAKVWLPRDSLAS